MKLARLLLLLISSTALSLGTSSNGPRGETGQVDADVAAKLEDGAPEGPFSAKPYLQLGHSTRPDKLTLLWQADDSGDVADWSVEYRPGPGDVWRPTAKPPAANRIAVPGTKPHRVYHLALTGLEPGGTFAYRVLKGGETVFESEGHAPKVAGQPQRFVVFGDCGVDGPEQRAIAHRAFLARPDYLMVTGDMVYGKGLISEYRKNFWPIYNADTASPSDGAPILRSIPTTAAPGNHDIGSRDLSTNPDGLAYFYYWFQPLNGPVGEEGGPIVAPVLGPEENRKAFLDAAGKAFPRMANFSFDYGDVHWTVLDANATVDWTDPILVDWLARDLASAQKAAWRLVSFHQPGFNSSRKHFDEQYMRVLAPVFEAGKVDVVFSGHVHNYQRSYPLTFIPAEENGARPFDKDGIHSKVRHVAGQWTLDKSFDGTTDTTAEGILYIITGAGGQHLYNPEQQDDPASWQEFTFMHLSKTHSLSVVEVDGDSLLLKQLTPDGQEIDRFLLTR